MLCLFRNCKYLSYLSQTLGSVCSSSITVSAIHKGYHVGPLTFKPSPGQPASSCPFRLFEGRQAVWLLVLHWHSNLFWGSLRAGSWEAVLLSLASWPQREVVCRRSCCESESERDAWAQSAVAQLPFIDSNMSQKAPMHMVPKITSDRQHLQPFYSAACLEGLLLGQIPSFPTVVEVLLRWSQWICLGVTQNRITFVQEGSGGILSG